MDPSIDQPLPRATQLQRRPHGLGERNDEFRFCRPETAPARVSTRRRNRGSDLVPSRTILRKETNMQPRFSSRVGQRIWPAEQGRRRQTMPIFEAAACNMGLTKRGGRGWRGESLSLVLMRRTGRLRSWCGCSSGLRSRICWQHDHHWTVSQGPSFQRLGSKKHPPADFASKRSPS